MKPLKQLQNLWNLSKIDPVLVEEALETLDAPIGDGSAVFFDEGNESEYQDFVINSSPWRKFYNKIRNL